MIHYLKLIIVYDELCMEDKINKDNDDNPMIDTEYLANDEYLSSKMLNYECKLNTPNSSMPPDVL